MDKPKRNTYITIKTTLLEKRMIKIAANEAGLDISKYLRKVALGKNVRARLSPDEIDLYKQLVYAHNSWKSIGNLFTKKDPKFKSEVHNLAESIRVVLEKFQ